MKITTTVGQFLFALLYYHEVRHIYGVPGDAITGIRKELNVFGKIKHIMVADEETAGWSAEVYGRIKKLGAVYVTYNAGANKILNPIDEGSLHNSALVVIGGEPSMEFRASVFDVLHHHQIHLRNFLDQQRLFAVKLTDTRTKSIMSLQTASEDIAIMIGKAVRDRLPVYIGMPSDYWGKEIFYEEGDLEKWKKWYDGNCHMEPEKDTVDHIIVPAVCKSLDEMRAPFLFTGHALQNFGLLEKTVAFAERLNIPVVASFNGYGEFPPDHPLFIGTYNGPASVPCDIRKFTECAERIEIGLKDTDLNRALQPETVRLAPAKIVIDPIGERVRIGHWWTQCNAEAQAHLLEYLARTVKRRDFEKKFLPFSSWIKKRDEKWVSTRKNNETEPITVADIAPVINDFLKKNEMPLLCDVGDPMFIALEILPSPPLKITYTSIFAAMGIFSGCIGLEHATGKRPLILVGDGAFCMGETYSLALTGAAPIIVILDNGGYAMMRQFGGENKKTESGKGHDSLIWPPIDFHANFTVGTVREFKDALQSAFRKNAPVVITVIIDPDDKSESLRNFKDVKR